MKTIVLLLSAVLLATLSYKSSGAAEQAGVTAVVRGEVTLEPVSGQAAHAASSGEEVFLGDGLSSGDQSGLQLMLLDETIFTLGPNTDLTIDDFVYDPVSGAGQMSASLTKGVFRFIAGTIAQGDPGDMTIDLPSGTIGIRGTTGIVATGVVGRNLGLTPGAGSGLSGQDAVDLSEAFLNLFFGTQSDRALQTDAAGDRGEGVAVTVVVLLETTGDAYADNRGMVVTSGGESVELTVPGFATLLFPGQPPVTPFPAPDLSGFDFTVVAPDEAGNFIDQAGASSSYDLQSLFGGAGLGDFDPTVDDGGLDGNLDSLRTESAIDALKNVSAATANFTSFTDLFALSGTGSYSTVGVFTQTAPTVVQGDLNAGYFIDFANRLICSCTIIITAGSIFDSVGIAPFSYAGFSGVADSIVTVSGGFFDGTTISLIDSDGIFANVAATSVTYFDGSFTGSTDGLVISAPR